DEGGRAPHDIQLAGRAGSPPPVSRARSETLAAAMTATSSRLFAMSRAGETVYAVGDAGAIATSSDGGKTWAARASGMKRDLRFVWARSTSEAYVVGSGVLAATQDGKTWRTIAM